MIIADKCPNLFKHLNYESSSGNFQVPSPGIVKFREVMLTALIEAFYCPCFTLSSSCPIAKTLFQLLLNVVKVVKISH